MAAKDSNGYFEYIRLVRSAKLLAREKGLLYFYASMYNWDESSPSFAGIDLIAAWTGMSKATVNRAKKRLKQLGWIRDYRKDRNSRVFVWVTKGKPDPEYDLQEFAKFHRETAATEIPSFEESEGWNHPESPDELNDDHQLLFETSTNQTVEGQGAK